jgi:hypothetical protein
MPKGVSSRRKREARERAAKLIPHRHGFYWADNFDKPKKKRPKKLTPDEQIRRELEAEQ